MNLVEFKKFKNSGEKIACLTAYDSSIAKFVENCGIDAILIGDSLGMVIKGFKNTRLVKMADMIYHTKAVTAVCDKSLIIVDMPYKSYTNADIAVANAKKLISAGAQMVKLEGGFEIKNIIQSLVNNNISVCAHLGLQPQKFTQTKDYKTQGTNKESALNIIKDVVSCDAVKNQVC